jgi:hypothetical protein
MHSLVALGFVCDEFNLRLCGVCGCKNGGAHDQKFSAAQKLATAFVAALDGVCALFFMFLFFAQLLISKEQNLRYLLIQSPSRLCGKGETTEP